MRIAPLLCTAALSSLLLACHGPPASSAPDAGPPDAGDGGPLDGGGNGPGDGGAGDAGPDAGVKVLVRAIFPGQGPAEGGGSVLVTGQGFVEGFASRGGGQVSKQTQVTLGGAQATEVDVIDDNRLQLTVPPGTPGAADVVVTNPNGAGTCAGCYRYLARVQVDALEPARGPTRGGTAITVRGQGFVPGMLLTLGGAEVIGLQVTSATTATALTPPGAPGGAEVVCATRDGQDKVRSGFVYQEPLRVDAVDPQQTSSAGGAALLIAGHGFTAQAQVTLDQAPLATRWIDGRTLAVTAPPHASGPVDVAVSDPGALPPEDQPAATPPRATLARGLVFQDPLGAVPGALALWALSPRHGPLSGGTCPSACVLLAGAGLSLPDLAVSIGGVPVQAAAVHVRDDRSASVDLPAGAQAGPVEVRLSSASQGAQAAIPSLDPGAFRYDPTLVLSQITPAAGPASGSPPVQVTLTGEGFASPGAPIEVRIGALDAAQVQVAPDGRSLTATAPAGAPGQADVAVVVTFADGTRHTATLAFAFAFHAPLALFQVEPSSGAQSGGAQVTLRGRGFTGGPGGLTARFGTHDALALSVISPGEARCTLPAGAPGAVPVLARQGAEEGRLASGFTYFDPQTNAGGTGGGPLLGTLNVTVVDGTPYIDGNVAGATVELLFQDGTGLAQLTDGRGQTTFADVRLVLPVQVTARKETYDAITIVAHQTANLTVYLSGPIPPPPPPPDPPPPPPPAPLTATVGGHVYGFKAPPSLHLGPNQRLVAYLRTSRGSIYSAPPFSPPAAPIVVDHDGGAFSFQTTRLSPITLTAEFGVEENLGQNLTSFTPILLGVRRGVQADPARPLTDADVLLDTHLDQQAVATCTGLPEPAAGNGLLHEAGVLLDLGNSGFVPLSNLRDAPGPQLTFPRLPQSAGQGFVFVDEVVSGRSVTVYLRRVFGEVLGGLTLGPYLPFPNVQAPPDLAPLPAGFDGTFSWTQPAGLAPNLLQLRLNGGDLNWTVVMPGDSRRVRLPPGLLPKITAGTTYSWTLTASLAPGFDFTFWSYYDLYGGAWTSYAYTSAQFTVPK